ncbi:uncharacterized protein LOC112088839 [Eutrema salsugineum]|uniref:uncharacterized protein LOC112088839 n=1 Tax=Eutrema salsugineum TaxID=72664 RepID=UPI000CED6A90|nr:uncharacterized protein LOC112088839 [Eutrema salsugineum]
MEFGLKVSKAHGEPEIYPTNYRRNIGCLRYLLHTRPYLAFSVGVASRYMQSRCKSHGEVMKHILWYLKGTSAYGLKFKRGGSKKIIGFSDSSHIIDQDDERGTTKQDTVALSTCEAEFMEATEAARQAIWLQELLREITG